MEIRNIAAHPASTPAKVFSNAARTPAAPGDTYSPCNHLKPGATKDFSQVLRALSLNKKNMNYCISSFAPSPDGTSYITYASSKAPAGENMSRGYLAALSPEGELLWESPVVDKGLRQVTPGSDGALYARTETHLRILNSDGTLRVEHTFDEPVSGHWMDADDTSYFTLQNSRELYIVDCQGGKLDLPPGLKGIKCHEVEQFSPGQLFVRKGKTFQVLDLAAGKEKAAFTFNDPVKETKDFKRYIENYQVTPEGEVLVWINNMTVIQPMLNIGHNWAMSGMPHPPLDDAFYMPTVSEYTSVARLNAQGEVKWEVSSLDKNSLTLLLEDGTLLYTSQQKEQAPNPEYGIASPGPQRYIPKTIATGRVYLGTIDSNGNRNSRAFTVEGKVKRLLPAGDNVIIQHGDNQVSRYSKDGTLLHQQSLPADERKLHPGGMLDERRLLLQDAQGSCAYSLDMETGALKDLTLSEKDLSYRVISKELEKIKYEPGEGSGDSIEEYDDWIDVGGVKIPRQ